MGHDRPVLSKRWQCVLFAGGVGTGLLVLVVTIAGLSDLVAAGVLFLVATTVTGSFASYLYCCGPRDGAVLGALAGVTAILPWVVVPLLLLVVVSTASDGGELALAYFAVTAVFFVVGLIAAAVSGTIGGVLFGLLGHDRDPSTDPDPPAAVPDGEAAGEDPATTAGDGREPSSPE